MSLLPVKRLAAVPQITTTAILQRTAKEENQIEIEHDFKQVLLTHFIGYLINISHSFSTNNMMAYEFDMQDESCDIIKQTIVHMAYLKQRQYTYYLEPFRNTEL